MLDVLIEHFLGFLCGEHSPFLLDELVLALILCYKCLKDLLCYHQYFRVFFKFELLHVGLRSLLVLVFEHRIYAAI